MRRPPLVRRAGSGRERIQRFAATRAGAIVSPVTQTMTLPAPQQEGLSAFEPAAPEGAA